MGKALSYARMADPSYPVPDTCSTLLFVPLRRGVVYAKSFGSAELAPYTAGNPAARYPARPVRLIRG